MRLAGRTSEKKDAVGLSRLEAISRVDHLGQEGAGHALVLAFAQAYRWWYYTESVQELEGLAALGCAIAVATVACRSPPNRGRSGRAAGSRSPLDRTRNAEMVCLARCLRVQRGVARPVEQLYLALRCRLRRNRRSSVPKSSPRHDYSRSMRHGPSSRAPFASNSCRLWLLIFHWKKGLSLPARVRAFAAW